MCKVQTNESAAMTWQEAGQPPPRCSTSRKVYSAVGSIFTAAAVVTAAWGLYDIYSADPACLHRGILLVSVAAASALTSTVAWTFACCIHQ